MHCMMCLWSNSKNMKLLCQTKKQIQEEYQYTDFQMRQIKYIIFSLFSELSKLFLLYLFFSHISKTLELTVSIFAMLSVRIFTGGIHLKHYFSCLLLSWGILFMSICILPNFIYLDTLSMMLIMILCIMAIYFIGPIPSSHRPALSDMQKKRDSIKAATSILIYIYLTFVFQKNDYLYTGFWSILLQTLQLGFSKINLLKKGRSTHERNN